MEHVLVLGLHDAIFRKALIHAVHLLPDELFLDRRGRALKTAVHIVEGRPQDELHPLTHGLEARHIGHTVPG